LLYSEDQILLLLSRRHSGPTKSLLHRSIHERPGSGGTLAGAAHYVVNDRPTLLALDPALLDEIVDHAFYPVPRSRRSTYLQENQPLQSLANRTAHQCLPNVVCLPHIIHRDRPGET
jgi:hypothetical protein